jgi:DnaJ-class molecular chaperone
VALAQPPHASCLGSDERPLIAYLKKPRTLEEIDHSDLCTPSRAGRLLAFLDAVGALELEGVVVASPYSLLGLPDGASQSEVKRAFRKLAQELHPDRHPAASDDDRRRLAERFAAIHAAYRQILV